MDAVDHQRIAQFTRGDHVLESHVLSVEAAHEADLDELPAQRFFLPNDRVGRADVGGQRLLAEHRNAAIEARIDLLGVRSTWRGEKHCVDLRVLDRCDRITDHPRAELAGHLLGFLGEEVVDHRHLRAADALAQRFDVEGAHHSDTEDSNLQITHCGLPKSMVAPLQELR
jgi:hypothetical protein